MNEPLTNVIPEGFQRWDAAESLKTDEDAVLYFDACLAEDPGDGSLVRAALGDIARARGISQLARDTGLSREGLRRFVPQFLARQNDFRLTLPQRSMMVHTCETYGQQTEDHACVAWLRRCQSRPTEHVREAVEERVRPQVRI
jgi:probable addiction module antidote protein